MSTPMSPLESLGLEVAAFQLLGSRTKASVLRALIEARGRRCSYATLAAARPWKGVDDIEAVRIVVKTRVCVLRDSLEDVGLGGLIQTHDGQTYSLPDPGRSQIIERLIEVAA